MNTPGSSPYIDDLGVNGASGKGRRTNSAYGRELIKVLANYEAKNRSGFFTQRNADNYAWFAMAKYVEQELGAYPTNPRINTRSNRAPTDGSGRKYTGIEESDGNPDLEGQNPDPDNDFPAPNGDDPYRIPGRPD